MTPTAPADQAGAHAERTSAEPVGTDVANPLVEAIDAERARIDALDAEIAALVRQRQEVSRGIQHLRMSAGRPRVEHSREIAVLAGYKRALGPLGTRLGMTVLDLCRGLR